MKQNEILTIIVVSIGLSVIMMDTSMVAIALPSINEKIYTYNLSIQWIINIVILTIATFGIVAGKISDIYGVKKLVATGLTVFLSGSLGCFFSNNFIFLLFFRAIQGTAIVLLSSPLIKLINEVFSPSKISHALGLTFGIASTVFIIAPVISGQIIKYFEWNYIFLVSVPITIVGIWCVNKIQLKCDAKVNNDMNYYSFILLSLGLFTLTFSFMEGSDYQWASPFIVTLMFVSLASLVLFIMVERYSETSLINYKIFSNKKYSIAVIISMMSYTQSISVIFWIMYMQNSLGFTPTSTALLMVPFYTLISIGSFLSGLLIRKQGVYKTLNIAAFIAFFGFILTYFFLPDKTYYSILPIILCCGISSPLFTNATRYIAINSAKKETTGIHIGALGNFRQISGTISLAIFTSIVNNNTRNTVLTSDVLFYNGFHIIILTCVYTSFIILILSTIINIKKNKH